MGNPYLDLPWKSEGNGAHWKSLSGSATEIRWRRRPWEILISISCGNPRAMALMGNPCLNHPWKSEGDGAHGKPLSGSAMEIRWQYH